MEKTDKLLNSIFGHSMNKNWIFWAAILGALAVGIGAFGAHGLKPKLSSEQIEVFKTASQYHFYHAFALLLIGILSIIKSDKLLIWAGYLMIAGILMFSGSLYLLASRQVLGIESWTWLGPLTPLGGFCFILAWIFIGIYGMRRIPTSL